MNGLRILACLTLVAAAALGGASVLMSWQEDSGATNAVAYRPLEATITEHPAGSPDTTQTEAYGSDTLRGYQGADMAAGADMALWGGYVLLGAVAVAVVAAGLAFVTPRWPIGVAGLLATVAFGICITLLATGTADMVDARSALDPTVTGSLQLGFWTGIAAGVLALTGSILGLLARTGEPAATPLSDKPVLSVATPNAFNPMASRDPRAFKADAPREYREFQVLEPKTFKTAPQPGAAPTPAAPAVPAAPAAPPAASPAKAAPAAAKAAAPAAAKPAPAAAAKGSAPAAAPGKAPAAPPAKAQASGAGSPAAKPAAARASGGARPPAKSASAPPKAPGKA